MKKLLIVILVSLIGLNPIFAADKVQKYAKPSIVQAILGVVMVGAGAALALEGFKQVTEIKTEIVPVTTTKDVDISAPAVTSFSGWSWDKYQIISWWVDASGGLTNTGNVRLNGVTVRVSLYDNAGFIDSRDVSPFPSSCDPNVSMGWSRTSIPAGGREPTLAGVEYFYTSYDPKTERRTTTAMVAVTREETKTNNQALGIGGIVSVGIGGAVLLNYLVKRNRYYKQWALAPTKNAYGYTLAYKF